MKISILTPVRRRPHNIKRFMISIGETMSDDNEIEVVFRLDETDELLNNDKFMGEIFNGCKGGKLSAVFTIGPETFPDLSCLWNECYEASTGDIVQAGGDDLVYESASWDQTVINAFNKYPDKIVLVWGQDSCFGPRLATHPFLSRKWVDTLGWVFPPIGLTYASDDFVFAIGTKLNRLHFIGEMNIIHKWDGSNPDDPNYARLQEHFHRSHDILNGAVGQNLLAESLEKLGKEIR